MKKEKLDIVYEDNYIIIVNKRSGLLTISNAKEKYNTLYYKVSDYLKKKYKGNKIFIVHRLDKDTSGLIIFAKSEKVKRLLQDNWANVKRNYYGIVYGNIKPSEGTLKAYLKETKTNLVYSTNKYAGKLAITHYQKIKNNKNYSLLNINIETGRKNQIRVQLNDFGYPLVGDKIYSKIKNKHLNKLYLHAYYLEFIHPITKEKMKIKIDYPKYFDELI